MPRDRFDPAPRAGAGRRDSPADGSLVSAAADRARTAAGAYPVGQPRKSLRRPQDHRDNHRLSCLREESSEDDDSSYEVYERDPCSAQGPAGNGARPLKAGGEAPACGRRKEQEQARPCGLRATRECSSVYTDSGSEPDYPRILGSSPNIDRKSSKYRAHAASTETSSVYEDSASEVDPECPGWSRHPCVRESRSEVGRQTRERGIGRRSSDSDGKDGKGSKGSQRGDSDSSAKRAFDENLSTTCSLDGEDRHSQRSRSSLERDSEFSRTSVHGNVKQRDVRNTAGDAASATDRQVTNSKQGMRNGHTGSTRFTNQEHVQRHGGRASLDTGSVYEDSGSEMDYANRMGQQSYHKLVSTVRAASVGRDKHGETQVEHSKSPEDQRECRSLVIKELLAEDSSLQGSLRRSQDAGRRGQVPHKASLEVGSTYEESASEAELVGGQKAYSDYVKSMRDEGRSSLLDLLESGSVCKDSMYEESASEVDCPRKRTLDPRRSNQEAYDVLIQSLRKTSLTENRDSQHSDEESLDSRPLPEGRGTAGRHPSTREGNRRSIAHERQSSIENGSALESDTSMEVDPMYYRPPGWRDVRGEDIDKPGELRRRGRGRVYRIASIYGNHSLNMDPNEEEQLKRELAEDETDDDYAAHGDGVRTWPLSQPAKQELPTAAHSYENRIAAWGPRGQRRSSASSGYITDGYRGPGGSAAYITPSQRKTASLSQDTQYAQTERYAPQRPSTDTYSSRYGSRSRYTEDSPRTRPPTGTNPSLYVSESSSEEDFPRARSGPGYSYEENSPRTRQPTDTFSSRSGPGHSYEDPRSRLTADSLSRHRQSNSYSDVPPPPPRGDSGSITTVVVDAGSESDAPRYPSAFSRSQDSIMSRRASTSRTDQASASRGCLRSGLRSGHSGPGTQGSHASAPAANPWAKGVDRMFSDSEDSMAQWNGTIPEHYVDNVEARQRRGMKM